jgi:hypothetical protein
MGWNRGAAVKAKAPISTPNVVNDAACMLKWRRLSYHMP